MICRKYKACKATEVGRMIISLLFVFYNSILYYNIYSISIVYSIEYIILLYIIYDIEYIIYNSIIHSIECSALHVYYRIYYI